MIDIIITERRYASAIYFMALCPSVRETYISPWTLPLPFLDIVNLSPPDYLFIITPDGSQTYKTVIYTLHSYTKIKNIKNT